MTEIDTLRDILNGVLPRSHFSTPDLARILLGLISGAISVAGARSEVADNANLMGLISELAGRKVNTGSTVINFGTNNNIGDISFKDIAGGNITHVTISIDPYLATTSPTLSELLVWHRNKAGLSQEELALAVNESVAVIDEWERAEDIPRQKDIVTTLGAVLNLSDIELDEMLCVSGFNPEIARDCDELAVKLGRMLREQREFINKYRSVVAKELDRFELLGVRQVDNFSRRMSLSKAYITLSAGTYQSSSLEEKKSANAAVILSRAFNESLAAGSEIEGSAADYRTDPVKVDQILARHRRIMIRGEAGAGKTTLLQWIAIKSARRDFSAPLLQWNVTIPFFIRLRSIVDRRFPTPNEYIELVARNLTGTIPTTWIVKELERGRALFLIDGIDELPSGKRDEMLKDLSRLVEEYPWNVYIITSRPSGLKDTSGRAWKAWEDWVSEQNFVELTLDSMSPLDIKKFISNWHESLAISKGSVLNETEPTERKLEATQKAKSLNKLLNAKPQLKKLATNPLLCAMICALFQDLNENLPAERNELYKECIEMLLERDRGRKVYAQGDRLYPAGLGLKQEILLIQRFAYWLMNDGYTDIESSKADAHFNARLKLFRLPYPVTGKQVRTYFVDRANLLREPVVGRIDFVHRTFQEFLAAQSAIHEDKIDTLIGNAHNDLWRETVIIAAGLARPKERKRLLEGIVDRGNREEENRRYLHLLAVACLETFDDASESVQNTVIENVKLLIPPQDETSLKAVVSAGDAVVELLYAKLYYSEVEAIQCIHALSMIGTNAAMSVLATYAEDKRQKVVAELRKAWDSFDRKAFARTVFADAAEFYAPWIETWEGFEFLDSLEKLEISLGPSITHLKPLSKLVYLEQLNIDCGVVNDLSPISYLQKLSKLYLSGLNLHDLTPLQFLKGLTSLSISNFQNPDELSTSIGKITSEQAKLIQSIEPLSGMTKLNTLVVGETAVSNWNPLLSLPSLHTLIIDGTVVDDIGFLPELLPRLETLVITTMTPSEKNVAIVEQHKRLSIKGNSLQLGQN